jgi:hypothetical protein
VEGSDDELVDLAMHEPGPVTECFEPGPLVSIWLEPGQVDLEWLATPTPASDEVWLMITARSKALVEHVIDGPYSTDGGIVPLTVPEALRSPDATGTLSVRMVARQGDETVARLHLPRLTWVDDGAEPSFSVHSERIDRLITSGEETYVDTNL